MTVYTADLHACTQFYTDKQSSSKKMSKTEIQRYIRKTQN